MMHDNKGITIKLIPKWVPVLDMHGKIKTKMKQIHCVQLNGDKTQFHKEPQKCIFLY